MLAEDMGREAIRVGAGGPLGVGQQINLAMRLFERLRDAEFLEPAPPCRDLVDRCNRRDARA